MNRLKEKSITIIKIGGGVITDKNTPYSIREVILDLIISDLITINTPMIIVHGGGSFGHPLAKKYMLQKGFDENINEQLIGLTKTHNAMIELNQMILKKFLKHNYPVFPIHPSSAFYLSEDNKIEFNCTKIIEKSLIEGFTPILYGDVVFSKVNSFQILSGDRIIVEICKVFKDLIKNVVFSIEEDGIFGQIDKKVESNEHSHTTIESPKLITKMSYDELDHLVLHNLGIKIDITGGIAGKLENIKEISTLGLDTYIVNGTKPHYLNNCLIDKENSICTKIMGK